MGKSLLAVISTRRPSQDSVSADAELLGSDLNGLLGPPELGAIGPDASQDHGNLARHGDTGFLGAYAPYQSRPPSLERRPALYLGQKGAGGFIEASSAKAVSASRDLALSIPFLRIDTAAVSIPDRGQRPGSRYAAVCVRH